MRSSLSIAVVVAVALVAGTDAEACHRKAGRRCSRPIMAASPGVQVVGYQPAVAYYPPRYGWYSICGGGAYWRGPYATYQACAAENPGNAYCSACTWGAGPS